MVVKEARVHVADEIKAELEKHKMVLEQAAVVDNPNYTPESAVPDQSIASIAAPNMELGGLPRRPTASFIDASNRRRTIQDLEAITARVAKIADPNRDPTDLWRSVHGSKATRAYDPLAIHTKHVHIVHVLTIMSCVLFVGETRMEVVAWIAVTKHGCRLEGGFIRDWIVAGTDGVRRPPSLAASWVKNRGQPGGDWTNRPEVDPGLGPQDLDLQLPIKPPTGGWFDIERFVREVQEFGISVDMVHRDDFLRSLLFDADDDLRTTGDFGPFLADLIEPHQVALHDQLDFDVNNLYCIAGFPNELGLKVAVPAFTLESTIANIQDKKLVVAKPRDNKIQQRISKMEGRGWSVGPPEDDIRFTPNRGFNAEPIITDVPRTDVTYQRLMHEIAQNGGEHGRTGRVRRIQRISSMGLDTLYDSHRAMIEREVKEKHAVNEKFVWHGKAKSA